MKSIHFSSKTPEWETPQDLFDRLNANHHFTLDVCATKANAKCKKFYTKKQNGLAQEWKGTCFMNPPFGKEIRYWVQKAYESKCKVVALLPARTDTRWFHWHIYDKPGVRIKFLKGRLKFSGHKNSAPFPSMIVIFRG